MPPTRQSQLVLSPYFPPYRRYFLDFCFRSNFGHYTCQSNRSAGGFMSFASCNRRREWTTVCSTNTGENWREEALSQLAFSSNDSTRLPVYPSIYVEESDSSKRNSQHRGFIETENEKIDKSDDRLGDQSRRRNTPGCRNIPVCLYRIKARDSTLKLRQHPPCLDRPCPTPLSFAIPRTDIPRIPVTHWYSRGVSTPARNLTLRKV